LTNFGEETVNLSTKTFRQLGKFPRGIQDFDCRLTSFRGRFGDAINIGGDFTGGSTLL
jgi:hypothetical protein